jgi:light-regulated signal transduction histidine kinase (bacteriophytochrome)
MELFRLRRIEDFATGQPNAERHQPVCIVAHHLVNKLSAIIGVGDLLRENAEEETESAKRLVMVHELAKSAAKELTDHLQELQNGMPAVEKPVLVSANLPTRTSDGWRHQ